MWPEKLFEVAPSKMSENVFLQSRIYVVFILAFHGEKVKMIPQLAFNNKQGIHSGWKSWRMRIFSKFVWKSWKTMRFSPALAGKAGNLFLSLIIINSIIRRKMIISRNRIVEEKIFNMWDRPFFTKST